MSDYFLGESTVSSSVIQLKELPNVEKQRAMRNVLPLENALRLETQMIL